MSHERGTMKKKLQQTKIDRFFSSTRLTMELKTSMERYLTDPARKRKGLYAIVMPSGSGKTYLAENYGFLDIDDIVRDERVLSELMKMRFDAVESEDPVKWVEHNDVWYRYLRQALDAYDFARNPRVILLHGVEVAMQIGAEPLICLVPSERVHRENIANRGAPQRALAIMNRKHVLARHGSLECRVFENRNEMVLNACVFGGIKAPIMNPARLFSKFRLNPQGCRFAGYKGAPNWILEGKWSEGTLDEVEELYQQGKIPRIALSAAYKIAGSQKYYESDDYWALYEWFHLATEAWQARGVSRDIIKWKDVENPDTDWFRWFPPASELNRKQANVSLRRLFANLGVIKNSELLRILNHHIGEDHQFVTSLVICYLGVIAPMGVEVMRQFASSGLLYVSQSNWVEVHNKLHSLVRNTRTFFGTPLNNDDYARLQYTDLLVGRRPYDIDVSEEVEKRRHKRLDRKWSYKNGEWTGPNYVDDFLSHLKSSYRRLAEKPVRDLGDIKDFINRRFEYATKGGLTKRPPTIRSGTDLLSWIDSEIVRIRTPSNKRTVLESDDQVLDLLKDMVANIGYNPTGTATKFNEPSKKRVLLPGSLQCYMAMTYLLLVVEKGGQVGSSGLNIGDRSPHHYDKRLADKCVNLMFDFPDHNAYHSRWEMSQVVYQTGLWYCSDLETGIWFMRWVIDSFDQMTIETPDGEEKANSGLYTGWRMTTWINTVMNDVIISMAITNFVRIYGFHPCVKRDGEGDDVDLSVLSVKDARLLVEILFEMGYEGKEVKQLISKTRHEFLRCIFTDHGVRTCVNRALSNYVSGDLERTSGDPLDYLASNVSNIRLLNRRGLSDTMCRALSLVSVAHWGRVRHGDTYKSLPRWFIHSRREDGGLGIPDGDGKIWHLATRGPELFKLKHEFFVQDFALTKNLMSDKLTKLRSLGFDARTPTDEDLKKAAVDSIDAAALSRAIKELLENSEMDEFWNFTPTVTEKVGLRGGVNFCIMDDFFNWMESGEFTKFSRSLAACTQFQGLENMFGVAMEDICLRVCPQLPHMAKALDFRTNAIQSGIMAEWVFNYASTYARWLVAAIGWDHDAASIALDCLLLTFREVFPEIKM
jgi:hypothetical protein